MGEVVPPILSAMEIANLRLDDDGPSTADIEMLYDSHETLRAERDYFRRRLDEMLPAWDEARARVEELERLQADWESLDELTALRAAEARVEALEGALRALVAVLPAVMEAAWIGSRNDADDRARAAASDAFVAARAVLDDTPTKGEADDG